VSIPEEPGAVVPYAGNCAGGDWVIGNPTVTVKLVGKGHAIYGLMLNYVKIKNKVTHNEGVRYIGFFKNRNEINN